MKTLLFISLFAVSVFLSAQTEKELEKRLLFPEFTNGVLIYKAGNIIPGLLNYDTVDEQILYLTPDKSIMAIAKPKEVEAVQIGERFFEYARKDAFYERIDSGVGSFYIRWKSYIQTTGKNAAYGGHSQISSIRNVDRIVVPYTKSVKLNSGEKVHDIKARNSYFLKVNNKYKHFNSAQSLGKLIKKHKKEIEEFAVQESINFEDLSDIKKIVSYAYSLSEQK